MHDPIAALDYASRLRPAAERLSADLLIVMRVYFEKPRTVVGWKGLINDPGLDSTYRVNDGLRLARQLLIDVSNAGLPAGTEFLDTTLGQYYADAVAWGAIGARTVESQVHRELASGLSMPVGFKNRTDGNLQVAVDAIRSARHPHWFPSLARDGTPAVLGTSGNDQTHLVLRGGSAGPNFSSEHVRAAAELLRRHGLPASLMIDCSHANSGKDSSRQPEVAAAIAAQIAAGERSITGVMIESHLQAGAQEYAQRPLEYGCSVTDACLSWEQTLPVFANLAESVRARRKI
jgi:3-deoxy-7-phosphoheptulonate synthase